MCDNMTLFLKTLLAINIADNLGNTALHLAVEGVQVDAIDCLVDSGADMTIVNENSMAPIHLAADSGLDKSLEVRHNTFFF